MVLPGLVGIKPIDLATASPAGLELVEDQITLVITTLNDEIEALQAVDFPTNGHIAERSFGRGERSPLLALHHARAHGVVVDTLRDLRRDLRDFRGAVQEARTLLRDTDQQAEADAVLVLQRTESLDLGATAYDDAQVNHVNTQASDTPEPATSEDAS